jgi:coproporphyrinogen III oxidase-like Fe-S oxidoreductase
MRMVKRLGYDFGSMYIGGGTPTILPDELAQTIDLARSLFNIREVSCETNPNHLTPQMVELLGTRIQRMSVGVQSFDDQLLRKVNRLERFGTGEEILQRLHSIHGGFPSLNVDMIFNFPGQDETILRNDLRMVIESGANQTTFYPLMTSPSVDRSLRRTVGQVSHHRESSDYALIVQELSREFELSTAWTFSRKGGGLIDEYIVEYEDYVGIGSGSFSYLDGTLLVNTFSLKQYRQRIASHLAPIAGQRRFNAHETMWYRLMMDLFSLDKRHFKKRFGMSIEVALPLELAFFRLNRAFERDDAETITLTPRGRYMLVVMMREFFSGINRIRDQARQSAANLCNQDNQGLVPIPRASA